MEQVKHAFVICAYKESKYLEQCILSLKSQTLRSPILVVTSTPNDHIRYLCRKYKLSLKINEGEAGIAQDWNFGYESVDARFITIAHQDDLYFEEYAEQMMKMMEKEKTPLIGFSNYYELRNGRIVKNSKLLQIKRILLTPLKWGKMQYSPFVRRRILSLGSVICCPSVTMCKDNLQSPLFQPHFKSNVDWETWERISRYKGGFLYTGKPLMAHRIHEESETSAVIGDNRRHEEDFQMFQKFWPIPLAHLLANIYAKGEKYNEVTREK